MHIYDSPSLLIRCSLMSQLPNIDQDFLLKKRINKTAFKDSDLLKYIPFPVSLIREAFHYSILHASLDCATSSAAKMQYIFIQRSYLSLRLLYLHLILQLSPRGQRHVCALIKGKSWEWFKTCCWDSSARKGNGFILSEDLCADYCIILTSALWQSFSFPMKIWPRRREGCT